MSLVVSVYVLFLLVFCLVVIFHLFVWNLDVGMFPGQRSWISSFECGFVAQRVSENTFSYTYFILLVFFVVFDLEVSLLLKMPLQGIMFKNKLCYLFFLGLLAVGFLVEIRRGYVRWSY